LFSAAISQREQVTPNGGKCGAEIAVWDLLTPEVGGFVVVTHKHPKHPISFREAEGHGDSI
jgi:hypothetical protein